MARAEDQSDQRMLGGAFQLSNSGILNGSFHWFQGDQIASASAVSPVNTASVWMQNQILED